MFDISNLNIGHFFSDNNLDYEDELIIRREFLFDGNFYLKVNHGPLLTIAL